MKHNRKAFTLIELLVVVLIIGILAAVALPQYQVAVQKARLSKCMPLVKTIKDAEEAFFLANGYYTGIFDDLDLSLSLAGNPCSNADKGCIVLQGYAIDLFNGHDDTITDTDSPNAAIIAWTATEAYVHFLGHSAYSNQRFCLINEKVCKNMGGEYIGTLFGYSAYRLP